MIFEVSIPFHYSDEADNRQTLIPWLPIFKRDVTIISLSIMQTQITLHRRPWTNLVS